MLLGESFLNWLVDRPESEGEVLLRWLNMPSSWGVFLLLAVVLAVTAAVIYMYRQERVQGGPVIRGTLITLRILTLLFLLGLFLQPSISLRNKVILKPATGIGRDASVSFGRKDRITETAIAQSIAKETGFSELGLSEGRHSRVEIVNRLLANGKNPWFQDLRKKGPVRIVDFSSDVRNVTTLPTIEEAKAEENSENASPDSSDGSQEDPKDDEKNSDSFVPPLAPAGVATDISGVLSKLLSDDSNVSSIVLISDGQHNGSQDPMDWAQKAAKKEIPIFTVGVGDPTRPRNISVDEVYARSKVRPTEPFVIEALVRGEDLEQAQVSLQLFEQTLDPETKKPVGQAKLVQTKVANVPAGGGRARVNFGHTQNQPGFYAYKVVAEEIENEVTTKDNSRLGQEVEVVDDRVKVLLVSGGPSWEYQQVFRLLRRDPSIMVASWLQSLDPERAQEGDISLKTLPNSIEELGDFNIVILMDPDSRKDFDAKFMVALDKFLDIKAGGLLFMAGPHFTTEFLSRSPTRNITKYLPITVGDALELDFQKEVASTLESISAGNLVPEPSNLQHPIMMFHSDPEANRAQWEEIPNIFWAFPVETVKPSAKVLLKKIDDKNHSDSIPVLVSGRYSAGSVLYSGFNSSWRWRSLGIQAQYFDRFWIQVVRYLVESRSLQGQRRALVETDRPDYDLGTPVQITARVLDQQYQPLKVNKLTSMIATDGQIEVPVELKPVPGQPGEYHGIFVPQGVGVFDIGLKLPGGEDSTAGDQKVQNANFRVRAPSVEASTDWLNEPLLKKIAETTGGKYFTIDQWNQIPQHIPERFEEKSYDSQYEPLWYQTRWLQWMFFSIPVILLTAEWILRKRAKLL